MIQLFFFFSSVLFDMFDVDKQKVLTHDGLFRIYKLLFTNAISDDHILALVFTALRHPNLAKEGEITRDEFIQVNEYFLLSPLPNLVKGDNLTFYGEWIHFQGRQL